MIKVINKGYTLTVTSCENDGDDYKTKTKTVGSKEEAEKLFKVCSTLFKSCNNGEGGVGNAMNGKENQTLIDYVENNPEMFPELTDVEDEDMIMDYFSDLAYGLMGSSEFYDFRICKSCLVTYSPEDIYLEEIKF